MFRFATELLAFRYRPGREPSKMVAIVVPISNRPVLTTDEQISLRHLRHHLGAYEKFLIAPRGLKFRLEGFETRYFSRKFFGSMRAHSRLLYWPGFYKQFEDYKYILMHHLDALVFTDELKHWCSTDLDYVGAPWIPCAEEPWVKKPAVGNGGLALMKVQSILKVLSERYRAEPKKYWEDRFAVQCKALQTHLTGPRTELIRSRLQDIEVNRRNNDIFWSFHAARYFPEFKIPDWKTALRFAFEVAPKRCFELNGRKLPFGCHGWPKYDRAFWERYLIK